MMAEAASATAETASVVVCRLDTQVGTRRRPRSEKTRRVGRRCAVAPQVAMRKHRVIREPRERPVPPSSARSKHAQIQQSIRSKMGRRPECDGPCFKIWA